MGGGDSARGRGVGRGALDRDRGVLGAARRRPPRELDLGDRQPPLRRGDPGDHHADQPRRSGSCAGPASRSSSSTRPTPRQPDIPSVGATNWAGGLAATEHLLSLGHRRIGVITGFADMLCSLARLDGYRSGPRAGGRRRRPGPDQVRRLRARGRLRPRRRAARPPRPADRDLRGQRPAGVRRLRGGPPARPAHPRRPLRRRLRRAARQPLGLAAADHRAPAARGDGQRRRTDARRADRRPAAADQPGRAVHRAPRP